MASPLSMSVPGTKVARLSCAIMAAAFIIGIALRLPCMDGVIFGHKVYNLDINFFTFYFRQMKTNPQGFLSQNLTKISSLYLYLWLYLSHIQPLGAAYSVKLGSTLFDFLCAFWSWRIARLWYPAPSLKPAITAACIFLTPAVIMDSALWGQIDSTYISWLLGCLFFLMRHTTPTRQRHDVWMACFCYAIAINFKLQAVFLFPALCWLFGKGIIKIPHLLFIAGMYVFFQLPRYWLGLPLNLLFAAYQKQVEVNAVSVHYENYTNLYSLPGFPALENPFMFYIGFSALLMLMITGLVLGWRNKAPVNDLMILWAFILSTCWTPFFMSSIFERYYLAAILFASIAALRYRRLIIPVVLLHLAISLEYTDYLFDYIIISKGGLSSMMGAMGLLFLYFSIKGRPTSI